MWRERGQVRVRMQVSGQWEEAPRRMADAAVKLYEMRTSGVRLWDYGDVRHPF